MTKEQYKEITEWQDATFGQATALSKAHHLREEIKELIADIERDSESVGMEIADCFLLLAGCARKLGFTYEGLIGCIDDKMEINKARKWGKPDENGVVKHLKG